MDAGVPISAPVSGIAMGLMIKSDKEYAILSDICGLEDFNGDMDFKVAGTAEGITAMQMDVKTLNLTLPILKEALAQAKVGRATIMEAMLKAIDKPRAQVSELAPKIKTIKIDVTKIGELIGPSGKTIKRIIADTGAQVDVEDDGTVNVSGVDQDGVERALKMVENITKEVMAGEIYEGTVRRIENFGAFVEILPGKDGMVHVSDMSTNYVGNPNDKVVLGDKVEVRVKEIDNLGRINLSMILDPAKDKEKAADKGGGDRRPQSSHTRSQGRSDFRDRRQPRDDRKSTGPHFPTSRLVGDSGNKGFGRG
jgi:polyribonucleotide nucleotidyltransferase